MQWLIKERENIGVKFSNKAVCVIEEPNRINHFWLLSDRYVKNLILFSYWNYNLVILFNAFENKMLKRTAIKDIQIFCELNIDLLLI